MSSKHGGSDHASIVFVPFYLLPSWRTRARGGGTLGAHALALLKMLAEYAVARQGCYEYSSPDSSRSPLTPPIMQVSLWMQRWQQRLSTWLRTLAFLSRSCAFTALQGFSLQASSSARA